MKLPLAISVGDPAGVGPEISAQAAVACSSAGDRAALFGDAMVLERAFCGFHPPARFRQLDLNELSELASGEVGLVHVAAGPRIEEKRGPTAEGGRAQLEFLEAASKSVLDGVTRALVTGPMSKEAVTLAGVPFVGQTEHLALAAGLREDAVTMMFVGPQLKVGLVTTHVALADVARRITISKIRRTVLHVAEMLERLSAPAASASSAFKIAVTGLNPHAGESGLFGREEKEIIAGAIDSLRGDSTLPKDRVEVSGPRGAETVFREVAAGLWDGVVAMFHDQATIASKLLDWGKAVNVTWGLPFVRTSVDHGVAYDIAGQGKADPRGMIAALELAQRLTSANENP